jgi:membrane protease subunit HflC
MNRGNAKMLALIGLAALALVTYAATFIVYQWEVAIKLRLGKIIASEHEPGLHFMLPLLNNVKKFDARIQTLDARPQRFLTIEKKDVIVDSYAKWRITNPGQFYRSTGGDFGRTAQLLSERVNTALRDEFGKRTIQEVVSEDRLELMQLLSKKVDTNAAELGIEVIDVRVKKIDLPPEVSESVYQRMRAERERVARDLRAKGSEAAERIRADADRQRTVILAEAYKQSEEVRGQGDAKASEIYANAYAENRNFYSFNRSLQAYRDAFGQGGDMMVLQPDSEFFRYFNNKGKVGAASGGPSKDISEPTALSTGEFGDKPPASKAQGAPAPATAISPSRTPREATAAEPQAALEPEAPPADELSGKPPTSKAQVAPAPATTISPSRAPREASAAAPRTAPEPEAPPADEIGGKPPASKAQGAPAPATAISPSKAPHEAPAAVPAVENAGGPSPASE